MAAGRASAAVPGRLCGLAARGRAGAGLGYPWKALHLQHEGGGLSPPFPPGCSPSPGPPSRRAGLLTAPSGGWAPGGLLREAGRCVGMPLNGGAVPRSGVAGRRRAPQRVSGAVAGLVEGMVSLWRVF